MFREETPEVLEIANTMIKWSKEEWDQFKNGRFLNCATIEYAFLLADAGFNIEIDSAAKASKMIWPE